MVDGSATIVTVEVPAPGAGIVEGLKLTLVPAGTAAADSETSELKLPAMEIETVTVAELPLAIPNEGEREKSPTGAEVTFKLMLVECVVPPPEAVTVRV